MDTKDRLVELAIETEIKLRRLYEDNQRLYSRTQVQAGELYDRYAGVVVGLYRSLEDRMIAWADEYDRQHFIRRQCDGTMLCDCQRPKCLGYTVSTVKFQRDLKTLDVFDQLVTLWALGRGR